MDEYDATFVGLQVTVVWHDNASAQGVCRAKKDGEIIVDFPGGVTRAISLASCRFVSYATPQE